MIDNHLKEEFQEYQKEKQQISEIIPPKPAETRTGRPEAPQPTGRCVPAAH